MADSEDEYDRRRGRDKFRRERSDYQERRRDEWDSWNARDRGSSTRSGRDYRDYEPRVRRDRYNGSPPHDMSPPLKRVRRDWDDSRGYGYDMGFPGGGMGPPGMWGPPQDLLPGPGFMPREEPASGLTQPPMMTFKQFLASQDDSIDDQEAVKKYNEYKLEFKKQQISEFFLSHKEEEWFKSKYHPEEYGKRKNEQRGAMKRRLEVFLELMDAGWIENFALDAEKSDKILHFLDAVVIKLEGGTEFDLTILDLPPADVQHEESSAQGGREKQKGASSPLQEQQHRQQNDVKSDREDSSPPSKDIASKDSSSSDSDSDSDSHHSDEEEHSIASPSKDEDEEEDEKKEEATKNAKKEEEEEPEESKDPKPRPLHKTQSIFLRNLAPNITKKEVEAICKKYSGFLRVAIADPQPDRRFFRRGWVTFKPSVNIKEICWELNNIRLRDYELGAIINRDLTRRIRGVNGIASHKAVARSDVKTAARIIHHLDTQKQVWDDDKVGDKDGAGLVSSPNPLLKNITDYLIEEASAEEDELLGVSAESSMDDKDKDEECTLERDEQLLQVVDKLLLYLRVVHSLDYYNASDYPNEDEMPNRCGLMHARGSPPSSKVTQQEINAYLEPFNQKIQTFLQPQTQLTEEEALKLGKKDPEVEVEKFVQSNTQELAKDKWLCPLSGKKFKGPEFVRKHIFNKHLDKIEEVKEEVEYFNNYLMDPRRPQLPEHPANKGRPDLLAPPFPPGPPFMMGRIPPPMMGFPGFARPDMYSRPYKRNYGGRYSDPRKIIPYRDLDAPEDVDI